MKKNAGIVLLLSLLMGCATSQKLDQAEFENLYLTAELIENDIGKMSIEDILVDTSSRQIREGGYYCVIDWNKTILAHPNQKIIGRNIAEFDDSLDSLITEFLSGNDRDAFGEYKNQKDIQYRVCLRKILKRQFFIRNRQFPRPYEYSEVPCTISARRITAWKQGISGYGDSRNGKRAV